MPVFSHLPGGLAPVLCFGFVTNALQNRSPRGGYFLSPERNPVQTPSLEGVQVLTLLPGFQLPPYLEAQLCGLPGAH